MAKNISSDKDCKKIYNCCECSAEYCNNSSLLRHVKLKHFSSRTQINQNDSVQKRNDNIDECKTKNYICDICSLKYDLKCRLLRHLKIKHGIVENGGSVHAAEDSVSPVWYKCEDCDRSFVLWKSLLRHYRINHPSLTVPKKIKSGIDVKSRINKIMCDSCQIEFFSERSLKSHVIKYHIEIDNTKPPLKLSECSICSYKSVKSKLLFEHYLEVHGVKIKNENLNFKSYSEFLEWKECEERRGLNKYVKKHGPRKYKNGLVLWHFYCHRSGYYKQKGNGRRRLKHQGSKKYGKVCPSRMLVKIISSDNVTVDYIISHVGHDSEICHLTLSQKERLAIANKIEMKMTFDDILNEVRNGTVENNNRIMKSDCITRKDLHNIVRSFNLTPVQNEMKICKEQQLSNRKASKIKSCALKKFPDNINNGLNNLNGEVDKESDIQIGIQPTEADESQPKSQIYFEVRDISIIGGSIANKIEIANTVTGVPLDSDVSLNSETPVIPQIIIPLEEEITRQQKLLSTKEQTIFYTNKNFEELTESVAFQQSKQNYIDHLVQFISDNVNNEKELQIAKEITRSFMNTLKQNRENFVAISGDPS